MRKTRQIQNEADATRVHQHERELGNAWARVAPSVTRQAAHLESAAAARRREAFVKSIESVTSQKTRRWKEADGVDGRAVEKCPVT